MVLVEFVELVNMTSLARSENWSEDALRTVERNLDSREVKDGES